MLARIGEYLPWADFESVALVGNSFLTESMLGPKPETMSVMPSYAESLRVGLALVRVRSIAKKVKKVFIVPDEFSKQAWEETVKSEDLTQKFGPDLLGQYSENYDVLLREQDSHRQKQTDVICLAALFDLLHAAGSTAEVIVAGGAKCSFHAPCDPCPDWTIHYPYGAPFAGCGSKLRPASSIEADALNTVSEMEESEAEVFDECDMAQSYLNCDTCIAAETCSECLQLRPLRYQHLCSRIGRPLAIPGDEKGEGYEKLEHDKHPIAVVLRALAMSDFQPTGFATSKRPGWGVGQQHFLLPSPLYERLGQSFERLRSLRIAFVEAPLENLDYIDRERASPPLFKATLTAISGIISHAAPSLEELTLLLTPTWVDTGAAGNACTFRSWIQLQNFPRLRSLSGSGYFFPL